LREKILQLISNRINMKILNLLAEEPLNPRSIAERLGKDETNISRRLKAMEREEILRSSWKRIRGRNVKEYSLNVDKVEIIFEIRGCEIHVKFRRGRKNIIAINFYDFKIPKLVDFVGRERELNVLKAKKNFFVIEGMAGMGKTSLALKFINLSKGKKVFWHTLKELDTFNFLMNKLAVFMNKFRYHELMDYLKANGKEDYVKISLFLKGVDRENYVMVFDDHQRCSDEKINHLLENLQKRIRKAKVMVLSRVRPKFFSLDENIVEMRLSGLSLRETEELVASKGVSLSKDEMKFVQKRLSGHPLAIKMFLKTCKARGTNNIPENIKRSGIADYLMREVYRKLSKEELNVLKFISVFRTPVPREAIAEVSQKEISEAVLCSLERKMVLIRLNENYTIERLMRDLSYSMLENQEEAHRRAARYYLSEKSRGGFSEAMYHLIKAKELRKVPRMAKNRD